MKVNWQTKPFEDCIIPIEYTRKILRKDFLSDGQFPIVSQEAEFINGYWDDEDDVFKVKTPVIIFGDHTQILKYVDFDFVLGADGVKILPPCDFLNPKFFFYQLQAVNFSSLGYARHYRLLKELEIKYPPLPEQHRIVAILDKAFEAIATAKANAEKNLKNARELFESYLQLAFENKGESWKEKKLGDVCSLYQGIAINAKTKHALVEKSDLPLLRIKDLKNNTVEQYIDPNNYPANALVNEEDIIYTRTGSLGLVFRGKRGVLHNNSFKVVPNDELTKEYLFIWLQNPLFKSKIMELALKAAQPDITHAIFKIQEIAIPSVNEQKIIVKKLDALFSETQHLKSLYKQKIVALDELKKSILHKAFSGEL